MFRQTWDVDEKKVSLEISWLSNHTLPFFPGPALPKTMNQQDTQRSPRTWAFLWPQKKRPKNTRIKDDNQLSQTKFAILSNYVWDYIGSGTDSKIDRDNLARTITPEVVCNRTYDEACHKAYQYVSTGKIIWYCNPSFHCMPQGHSY